MAEVVLTDKPPGKTCKGACFAVVSLGDGDGERAQLIDECRQVNCLVGILPEQMVEVRARTHWYRGLPLRRHVCICVRGGCGFSLASSGFSNGRKPVNCGCEWPWTRRPRSPRARGPGREARKWSTCETANSSRFAIDTSGRTTRSGAAASPIQSGSGSMARSGIDRTLTPKHVRIAASTDRELLLRGTRRSNGSNQADVPAARPTGSR